MAISVQDHQKDFSPLHNALQTYIDKGILPCLNTLVLQGGDIVDVRYYGYLDLESKQSLPEDAIFRLYSGTKPITALAAMMLYESGKFQLDDPLAKYLPEFKDLQVLKADAKSIDDTEPGRPILIKHLMSHSAGFSYGFLDPASVIDRAYNGAKVNQILGQGTLADLCGTLSTLPLAYQPGTSWRYSVASDVLGALIEKLSDQSLDEFFKSRLFAPMGMVDTDFFVPENKHDRFTAMYASPHQNNPMAGDLFKVDDPKTGTYSRPKPFLSGGGGLVSTLEDYVKIAQLFINDGKFDQREYLKPETLALMRTNQLAENVNVQFNFWPFSGTTFGLGIALKESLAENEHQAMIGECHWGGLAGVHIWLNPKSNVGGICMTQRMPSFWHPFSHEFKRLAYEIMC